MRERGKNILATAIAAPIHLTYIIIIILGVIPNWSGAVDCDHNVVYPTIMVVNDCLFASVYVFSLILHCNKYFLKWEIISDDGKVPPEQFEQNERMKLNKMLFE